MKTGAILIIAWNRPKHLRVCLESIAKSEGISQWDIWVDIDGGCPMDFACCDGVIEHYRIQRTKNLGCMAHPTEALRSVLAFGYRQVLYVEDDMLFRSDLLAFVEKNRRNPCPVSTFHYPDNRAFGEAFVSNAPFLLWSAYAGQLVEFMDRKAYLGLPNVLDFRKPITDAVKYHDVCWYAWSILNTVPCIFASEQLACNFGFSGMNFNYPKFDELAFAGNPVGWLRNVVLTQSLPEFQIESRTPGFVYK